MTHANRRPKRSRERGHPASSAVAEVLRVLAAFPLTALPLALLQLVGLLVIGLRTIGWDGHDDHGRAAGAGVCFLRLHTPKGEQTLRIVRVVRVQ